MGLWVSVGPKKMALNKNSQVFHEYFIGLFVKIVVLGYTKCKKHCSIITIILVLGSSSLKVEVA